MYRCVGCCGKAVSSGGDGPGFACWTFCTWVALGRVRTPDARFVIAWKLDGVVRGADGAIQGLRIAFQLELQPHALQLTWAQYGGHIPPKCALYARRCNTMSCYKDPG